MKNLRFLTPLVVLGNLILMIVLQNGRRIESVVFAEIADVEHRKIHDSNSVINNSNTLKIASFILQALLHWHDSALTTR